MDKLDKIISDDCVEYRVYFSNSSVDGEFALATLSSLAPHIKQLSSGWQWHSEEFKLEVARPGTSDSSSQSPLHLCGVTHFGDNLDDEWFIVYLLLELTKVFSDLVVSVEDSDGQFLLIEAANVLPSWLTPEHAEGRVFLHKGCLHIIPQASNPGQVGIYPTGTPDIHQAVQLVADTSIATQADLPAQNCLASKLSIFPDHISTCQHVGQCVLPVSAAHVLHHDPALVAPAVQTFYARDPLQMSSCRTMKHFAPAKPGDCIAMNVRFTKCLYAQLRQQRFRPGVKSGWHVPPPSDDRHVACDLGMKLSYGLEILCKQAPKSAAAASDEARPVAADVCIGPRWDKFLSCLEGRDYFRQELQGSKEYQRLIAEARSYFAELIAKEDVPAEETLRRSTGLGKRIRRLLDDVPIDVPRLRLLSQEMRPAESEDWMTVDQADLDKLLEHYQSGPLGSSRTAQRSNDSAASASVHASASAAKQSHSGHHQHDDPAAAEVQQLVGNMKQFMSGLAGADGAEFPEASAAAGSDGVSFSAGGFASAISSLLNGGSDGEDVNSDIEFDDDLELGDLEGGLDDDDDGPEDSAMRSYFEEMERQLAGTDLGHTFDRSDGASRSKPDEELAAVDIDMNLVQNLLASYGAQEGLSGPAATILHGMGVNLSSLDPSAADAAGHRSSS